MINCKTFTFNPFQENSYLLYNASGETVIIDPGCFDKKEEQILVDFIERHQLKPVAVWLTHCHIDHVMGLRFCEQTWKIPFYLDSKEIAQLNAVQVYGPSYGFHNIGMPDAQGILFPEEELFLGEERFEILKVPGHAPGHVAFYHAPSHRVWAGDVLFYQSIGRTDLPGGDFFTLKKSILEKLYTLPGITEVFPGHGPTTRIDYEQKKNPYVNLRLT